MGGREREDKEIEILMVKRVRIKGIPYTALIVKMALKD